MNYIYILYEPRSILLLASIIIYAYILNYFMHMQDASMYLAFMYVLRVLVVLIPTCLKKRTLEYDLIIQVLNFLLRFQTHS